MGQPSHAGTMGCWPRCSSVGASRTTLGRSRGLKLSSHDARRLQAMQSTRNVQVFTVKMMQEAHGSETACLSMGYSTTHVTEP